MNNNNAVKLPKFGEVPRKPSVSINSVKKKNVGIIQKVEKLVRNK